MKQLVRSHDGLTLMEVVFAMAILATVLLGLMITFPKMKMLVNKSGCKVAAIEACQTKMEAVCAGGFSNLTAGTETDYSVMLAHGADFDTFDDDVPCDITTTVVDVDDGGTTIARKVTVQCTWIENNAECSEYLDCILYNTTIT